MVWRYHKSIARIRSALFSCVLIRLGPDPENITYGLSSLWEITLWDLIPMGYYPCLPYIVIPVLSLPIFCTNKKRVNGSRTIILIFSRRLEKIPGDLPKLA